MDIPVSRWQRCPARPAAPAGGQIAVAPALAPAVAPAISQRLERWADLLPPDRCTLRKYPAVGWCTDRTKYVSSLRRRVRPLLPSLRRAGDARCCGSLGRSAGARRASGLVPAHRLRRRNGTPNAAPGSRTHSTLR